MVAKKRFQNSKAPPSRKKDKTTVRDQRGNHSDQPRTLRSVLNGPYADWRSDLDWSAWDAFLCSLRGEKLSKAEAKLFRQYTGRKTLPSQPFNEAFAIVGRRGLKTSIAAQLAVYFSIYGKWRVAAGEKAAVVVCAVSKRQARQCLDYIEGLLRSKAAYERLITSVDWQSITLEGKGIDVEISCLASNFRTVRGRTIVCAILDELAFWWDETSNNPDTEVYRAIRPSMATIENSLLIGISSAYAKKGLLYQKFRDHYGDDESRTLIWRAPTLSMNPLVPAEFVAEEFKADPISAASEYNSEFRDDISDFLSPEAIAAVTDKGVRERGYDESKRYFGFIDFAGGSGKDSAVLAVAHIEEGVVILDALRERKPKFKPSSVTAEFAATLKTYRIREAVGDRYAGEFPRELLKANGIAYRLADKAKNDLYSDLLPQVNSGGCRLLDNERLAHQLAALERRTARNGRDIVDHPFGGHDDLANACAGVVSLALSEARRPRARLASAPPIFIRTDENYFYD